MQVCLRRISNLISSPQQQQQQQQYKQHNL
jgi:hypothetical protein